LHTSPASVRHACAAAALLQPALESPLAGAMLLLLPKSLLLRSYCTGVKPAAEMGLYSVNMQRCSATTSIL
jgi:hypothetical protein